MRSRSMLFVFIVLSFAVGALAQSLTVGNPWKDEPYGWPSGEGTFIDLVNPASGDGVVTRVGFALAVWEADVCTDVAAIGFFRFVDEGFDSYYMLVDERSPVSWFGDSATVPLLPPVKVRKGDMIGIRLLTNCGDPVLTSLSGPGRYLQVPPRFDVQNIPALRAISEIGSLAVWGTGSVGPVVGILPVVGSAPGLMDSQWRTSLQLLNPYAMSTTGRIIFRRARVPGSDADSSLQYSLEPGETKTFEDIMSAMNESGVGSIDLVSDEGLVPVALASIFNDGVGAGNFGTLDVAVDPEDHIERSTDPGGRGSSVLRSGDSGFLIGPASATRARFNMGVRTLDEGALIEASLLTASGNVLGTVTREYVPNFMEQMGVGTYFALPVTGGEVVRVTILAGSAIVYGSTVDNLTNDPAIQYVHAIMRADD